MTDTPLFSDGEPIDGLRDLKLSELINIPAFQDLLDSFYALTSMPTAILDLSGNILVASGWQKICTDFHRKNPISASRCVESDTVLAGGASKGQEFNIYKCKNGLIDVAVPLIIEDLHLGNLFAGQFLFEKPDIEFFTTQAEQLGFNKKEYLKALQDVPVISDTRMKKAVAFLTDLTAIIGSAAIDRKKLLFMNRNLKEQVQERTDHLEKEKMFSESLISSLPGVMYVFDLYGQFKSWNRNFEVITGYSRDDILGMTPLDLISAEDRPKVRETINEVFENGHGAVEACLSTISGETIPYLFTGYKFRQDDVDFLIGVGVDISDRVRSEQEKAGLIDKLQEMLSEVKKLSGLLPICASCKKIRDDKGYWNQLESYIHKHSEAQFSHGMCPECSDQLYGDQDWYINMKNRKR